ncbi:hypothetical protein LCGC14_2037420, partial [marine sediment metagenome]
QSLSDITSQYRLRINELQRDLRGVSGELSDVKKRMRDVNTEIKNISSRRFNIGGISETEISNLVRKQELELQKAKFATLGLGSAEEFLRSASLLSVDSINMQTEAMKRLIETTASGKDRFEAWRISLTETIRALVSTSTELDKDVTDVVKRFQTELLGISRFDQGGTSQFTEMEANLNALTMAQDIFFGEEQQKLSFSEQLREDRINGMNESAEMAINALESERKTLDSLIETEQFWIEQQNLIRAEIDENREAIDRETKAWNERKAAMGSGLTGARALIGLSLPGGGSAFGGGPLLFGGATVADDFISRPGQPLQVFSPDDTIIGTKNTGMGGGNTFNIDITMNSTGNSVMDAQTLAREIRLQMEQ